MLWCVRWCAGTGAILALKQYVGFVAGQRVTVLGRIVDHGSGRAIEAAFLFGGAPADYPSYQRGIAIDG
ncbi:hypothetical protein [Roseiflexus castenholzii]|jgi:hypothetical protein|uniref:hypothetical protein n=1 Tax=Roseiflexus castenholzii TaxID=120962 RepID=UPI00059B9B92|nr:hypothetical protein [Roseiflexus castenholzii]